MNTFLFNAIVDGILIGGFMAVMLMFAKLILKYIREIQEEYNKLRERYGRKKPTA